MCTWLFAWEFGEGLGHFRRLAAIAGALAREGDRIVVVAPAESRPRRVFPPGAEHLVLANAKLPPQPPARRGFLPSYGAAIANLGFESADHIVDRVRAWDAVFEQTRPDAVIADHAPYAVFATRTRIPTAVIGSGLDLPPADGACFPTILPNAAPFDETALQRALATAAAATGRAAPASVPAAVVGDRRFLAGFPAFDPYLGRRAEPHLGPLGARPALSPCPSEGLIFAYLRSDDPSFGPLCWALAEAGLPACVHWQGPSAPDQAALLSARGIEVADAPVEIESALARSSLIISRGGAGLTAEALFAGRPHLIFPIHLESELHALGLERLGAGRRLTVGGLSGQIQAAADRLDLRDGAMAAGAAAHEAFGQDPVAAIAEAIRKLA